MSNMSEYCSTEESVSKLIRDQLRGSGITPIFQVLRAVVQHPSDLTTCVVLNNFLPNFTKYRTSNKLVYKLIVAAPVQRTDN